MLCITLGDAMWMADLKHGEHVDEKFYRTSHRFYSVEHGRLCHGTPLSLYIIAVYPVSRGCRLRPGFLCSAASASILEPFACARTR